MKKTILILFLSSLAIFAQGQITTPSIRANFGIEGDLQSNYYSGAPLATSDDWFGNGNPGTGQFVIDTTGAAAIVARYSSSPVTRQSSFSRIMRQAPYSTVNNMLLLDAIFHRDFHGNDSTVFGTGSNKNGMSPVSWICPAAQSIPDKNDILDAYTHVRRAGPGVSDSLWMFSAISIENTTGSRYFDFELYQTDIYYDRPSRTFRNYGPDAGHTSWLFNAAGNIIQSGDIIFTAEFSGSSLSVIEARVWVNRTTLMMTPANFDWAGQFDGDGAGASYGYANIRPKTSGNFYTGLPCANNTWAGPFNLIRDDNSMVTTYLANQFLEFSVNLTKLGLDPGQTTSNPCGSTFRRVLIKTRASNSFTSELKDFIAPFRMFDYPTVKANTDIIYYCGIFPPTTITVQNPFPASVYTWNTPNGHISGSNTGTSIIVDAPGIYYVNQQLHVECPFFSKDSIIMYFDPVCTILDLQIINFKANILNSDAALLWTVSNNKNAAKYIIEYSFDDRNYINLAEITPNNMVNMASYSLTHPLFTRSGNTVYYRLKVIGKNNALKYSKTVELRSPGTAGSLPIVFPNPSKGEVLLSVNSLTDQSAIINCWNANGILITHSKQELKRGENLLTIPGLAGKPAGIYLLKIKYGKKEVSQKISLLY